MTKIRRWTIDGIGPQNLTISEGRMDDPLGRDVLVRTEAVSLNYRDKLVLETGMGLPLQFPSCRPPIWRVSSKQSAPV